MYRVKVEKCTGCGLCTQSCPVGAISLFNGKAKINSLECVNCGTCFSVCPMGAIEIRYRSELDELKRRIQNLKYKINKLNERINYLKSRR